MINSGIKLVYQNKSFMILALFRNLVLRQRTDDFICNQSRINHQTICIPRMNGRSFNFDLCPSSIERFIFDFARLTVVERIGKFDRKFGLVKSLGPLTDFFIRTECQIQGSVFKIRMFLKIFDRPKQSGNSGLVICP